MIFFQLFPCVEILFSQLLVFLILLFELFFQITHDISLIYQSVFFFFSNSSQKISQFPLLFLEKTNFFILIGLEFVDLSFQKFFFGRLILDLGVHTSIFPTVQHRIVFPENIELTFLSLFVRCMNIKLNR